MTGWYDITVMVPVGSMYLRRKPFTNGWLAVTTGPVFFLIFESAEKVPQVRNEETDSPLWHSD
jgi:hypothetical protein